MSVPQSIDVLQYRWDVFLSRISDTFNETLQEATPPLIQLTNENPGQTQPLLVAWSGIKSQLQQLISKIGNTWQETVSPQMEAYGYKTGSYDWSIECNKGTMLENKLHYELALNEIIIMGRCAELYYQKTFEESKLNFRCRQCTSPIEVNENIFRSHYESCPYCNTVNTYEPSTSIRNIEWFAVNNLAAYYCLPEWEEKSTLEYISRSDGPGNESYNEYLQKYTTANNTYWQKYLKERIKIIPELEANYEQDLARYTSRESSSII